MEIPIGAVNRVLATLIFANEAFFPFQLWMASCLRSLLLTAEKGGGSMRAELIAYLSIVIVYTVASSPTHGLLPAVLYIKTAFIMSIATLAISVYPERVRLAGLLVEAGLAGTLDVSIFESSLSVPLDSRRRALKRVRLLVITATLHLLMPRFFNILGLPTHLSINMEPIIWIHTITIVVHVIIKELLIFSLPHTFARLATIKLSGLGEVWSKAPVAGAGNASYKLSAFRHLFFWIFFFIAWDFTSKTPWGVANLPFVIRRQSQLTADALETVDQTQRLFGRAARFALLGRRREFLALWADIWRRTDAISAIRFYLDLLQYICYWMGCASALYTVWYCFWRL